jgi:HlyD family secretion protein
VSGRGGAAGNGAVIAIAALAVLGGVGLWAWRSGAFARKPEAAYREADTYVVRRGTLAITLVEDGTLKTKKATQIRAETNAKIEKLVDEGAQVKQGDVLVELEKTEVQRQIEQLENQVTQGESELKSARTELVIQEAQNLTDVEKAQLALEVAKSMLEKFIQGDNPQAKRQRELRIDKAESDVKRAEERVRLTEKMREQDLVTQERLDQERLQLKTARTELESAKLEMDLYLRYQEPLDLKQKEAALVEAERGLERARQRAEAQLEAKKAIVRQKEVSLRAAKERLEQQKEILAKMTLRAPRDGIVLYGDPDQPWTMENVKVGQHAFNNMCLITMPDDAEMAAIVYVHEADYSKVSLRMPAIVTSELQRGRAFSGEVVKIDVVPNAGNRWWSGDDSKKFKVEVAIQGENLQLRTGTSCRVELQLGEVPDVLFVPVQAVFAEGGKAYCTVLRDGAPQRVEVELGRSNETHIEVKKGLAEGDRVLLYEVEAESREDAGGR